MTHEVWAWFVATLHAYPELAVFLALAIGFGLGPLKLKGFALGSVTATLLAGILIGQLGITVSGPDQVRLLPAVPLRRRLRRWAAVLPRTSARRGPKQIVFSLIVLALCLIVPVACAWFAGLNIGYAAGSLCRLPDHLRVDRRRLGSDRTTRSRPRNAKAQADAIPIGYAVTYIFGTIGSAVLLAQLGPKLIGVDLPAACADYERRLGGARRASSRASSRRIARS